MAGVVLTGLAVVLTACGGSDQGKESDRANDRAAKGKGERTDPADFAVGVYVGKARKRGMLVAVVATPPDKGGKRDVSVYVSDGRRVNEHFPAKALADGDSFAADSSDRDAKVKGTIEEDSVSGTVRLGGRKQVAFTADRAAGAAGIYNLTVSPRGKLSGATPAGVGVRGNSPVRPPGTGALKLADGRKLTFAAAPLTGDAGVGSGRLVLIVTADGDVAGVGQSRGRSTGFLVRGN